MNPARHPLGTVLYLDDDESVLQAYGRMLRLGGYDLITSTNAEEALREAQQHAPDVIVLDLRMPLHDGLAFLQQVRADERLRTTPVAVVTGDYFVDEATVTDLGALGAEITFKPLWMDQLIGLVQRLMAQRG